MKAPWWQREPALIVGQIQALLSVAAGAGFVISANTTGTIIAVVTLVSSFLTTYVIRSKVSSPATVAITKATTDMLLTKAAQSIATVGRSPAATLCPAVPVAEVALTDPATGWPVAFMPPPVTPPAEGAVPVVEAP